MKSRLTDRRRFPTPAAFFAAVRGPDLWRPNTVSALLPSLVAPASGGGGVLADHREASRGQGVADGEGGGWTDLDPRGVICWGCGIEASARRVGPDGCRDKVACADRARTWR